MDANTTTQLSNEFESALSEILPDLYQLLQSYQISTTLEIVLFDLCDLADESHLRGISCVCGKQYQNPCKCTDPPGLEMDLETAQQFCTDIDSTLSMILPRLGQSAQQVDESFEVHFLIDSAPANSSQLSCRFVDGVLLCSDQPQGVMAS